MERKRLLAALVGLLLLIVVASCGGDDDGDEIEQQRFDLVIGNLAPISGDQSEPVAASSRKATDLALEQINEAIRETGADQSVQIVHGNTGGNPAAATRAAERMVEEHEVSCLVETLAPERTLEVAKAVTVPGEVLQITGAAPTEELADLDDDGLVNSVNPGTATPGASSEFLNLYGSDPERRFALVPFAAQAFDATILCYLAAVAAGSADGKEMSLWLIDNTAPRGTEYTWQELPEAVEALEADEDINYTGASGPIDMDENGNATASPASGDDADFP